MRWGWSARSICPEPKGTVEGVCPACGATHRMTRHDLLPRWLGAVLLFPSDDLLVCGGCGAVSRDETLLDRAMSALFLVPFLAISVGGLATAAWLAWQVVVDRLFDAGWALGVVGLAGLGSIALHRTVRVLRRLLSPRRKLPMAGWGTGL